MHVPVGSSAKAKSDQPSSLVQALNDSNPSMSSFLFPSSTDPPRHFPSNKPGHYSAASVATATSHLDATNTFLGRTQPGFPPSYTGLQDRDNSTFTSATTAINMQDTAAYNSFSNCLGLEWPGLGSAVAQINKGQGKPASVIGQGQPSLRMATGSGGFRNQLAPLMAGTRGGHTHSNPLMVGAGQNQLSSLEAGPRGRQTQSTSVPTVTGLNHGQSSQQLIGTGADGRSLWTSSANVSLSGEQAYAIAIVMTLL